MRTKEERKKGKMDVVMKRCVRCMSATPPLRRQVPKDLGLTQCQLGNRARDDIVPSMKAKLSSPPPLAIVDPLPTGPHHIRSRFAVCAV